MIFLYDEHNTNSIKFNILSTVGLYNTGCNRGFLFPHQIKHLKVSPSTSKEMPRCKEQYNWARNDTEMMGPFYFKFRSTSYSTTSLSAVRQKVVSQAWLASQTDGRNCTNHTEVSKNSGYRLLMDLANSKLPAVHHAHQPTSSIIISLMIEKHKLLPQIFSRAKYFHKYKKQAWGICLLTLVKMKWDEWMTHGWDSKTWVCTTQGTLLTDWVCHGKEMVIFVGNFFLYLPQIQPSK